jgi:hypothetical protein
MNLYQNKIQFFLTLQTPLTTQTYRLTGLTVSTCSRCIFLAMPVPRLPKDIQVWAPLYVSHKVQDFEDAEFESGSNFKYESALRLRVPHSIKDLVIHKRGTLWIKDFDIFREW